MSTADPDNQVGLIWQELKGRFTDIPGKVVAAVPLFFTVALPLAAAALADLFREQHVLNGAILVALVAVITALPLVAAAIALRSTDIPTLLMGLLGATAAIGLLSGLGTVIHSDPTKLIGAAAVAFALVGTGLVFRHARIERPEARARRGWPDLRAWLTEPTRLLLCAATIPVILLNTSWIWPNGDYPAQFTRDVAVLGQLHDGLTELDFAERRRELEQPGEAAPFLTDQVAVRELFSELAVLDHQAMQRRVIATDAVTALRNRALAVAANAPLPAATPAFVPTTALMQEPLTSAASDDAAVGNRHTALGVTRRLALTYEATRWGAQRRWADGFRAIRLAGVIAILFGIAALIVAAWTATVPLARSARARKMTGDVDDQPTRYAVRVQIILIAIVVELVIAVPMLRPIHPDEIRLDAPHQAFLQANWFLPRTVTRTVVDIVKDPHTPAPPSGSDPRPAEDGRPPDVGAHQTVDQQLDSLRIFLEERLPTWTTRDWNAARTRLFGTMGAQ